jgi:hypothetical protein
MFVAEDAGVRVILDVEFKSSAHQLYRKMWKGIKLLADYPEEVECYSDVSKIYSVVSVEVRVEIPFWMARI